MASGFYGQKPMDEILLYRDRDWLQEKYWGQELSTHEMAKLVGCSQSTVHRQMVRCSVSRRNPRVLLVSERFWGKVDKGSDCWEWQAYRNPAGYGLFRFDGRDQRAQRVAWQLTNGSIPEGMFVCHHCDNPACVRPSHLFLGSPLENSRDCVRKGRQARGTRNSQSKLSERDVFEIRRLATETDLLQREIAGRFGVTQCHVSEIISYKTWQFCVRG